MRIRNRRGQKDQDPTRSGPTTISKTMNPWIVVTDIQEVIDR
jgi:hypothetical protein